MHRSFQLTSISTQWLCYLQNKQTHLQYRLSYRKFTHSQQVSVIHLLIPSKQQVCMAHMVSQGAPNRMNWCYSTTKEEHKTNFCFHSWNSWIIETVSRRDSCMREEIHAYEIMRDNFRPKTFMHSRETLFKYLMTFAEISPHTSLIKLSWIRFFPL